MADSKFEPMSERDQKFSDMLLIGIVLALLIVTLMVNRSSKMTPAAAPPVGTTAPGGSSAPAPTSASPVDPSGMVPS